MFCIHTSSKYAQKKFNSSGNIHNTYLKQKEHWKSFSVHHKALILITVNITNNLLVLKCIAALYAELKQVSVSHVVGWESGKKNQGETPKFEGNSQSITLSPLTNSSLL